MHPRMIKHILKHNYGLIKHNYGLGFCDLMHHCKDSPINFTGSLMIYIDPIARFIHL